MAAPKGNRYAAGNRGGGRKSMYKAEYAQIAYRLCLLGKTDKEIGDILGFNESTINTWKKEHKEFGQALIEGKELADANVANALYHRAIGYSHPANKIMQNNGVPVIVPYTEHYPPDTQAATRWLMNRQPKLWRDKPSEENADTPLPDKVQVEVVDAGESETGDNAVPE